jgi:fructose-1,6-bisphosphatase/sedoheptulose 1,7-bisphosphatase-like protein
MRFVDEPAVHFLKIVETAAITAAKTMGQGDYEFIKDRIRDNPDVIPVTGK